MKKNFKYSAIGLTVFAAFIIPTSALIPNIVGTILFFSGIITGICGLVLSSLYAHHEDTQFNNQTTIKDLEVDEYKSTESLLKKDATFEKHAKQTLKMDASNNQDDEQTK